MGRSPRQEITIPYCPRSQFLPLHRRKQRFACLVAHRRAGKTVACINELIRHAILQTRPEPRLAYIAPFMVQAKDAAWSCLKYHVRPVPGIRIHESELRVDFAGGARIRLYGADNADRLRGIYLDHVILDEYANMDPRLWPEIIRPALADRRGGAVISGTPRGRNGLFQVWEQAQQDDDWLCLTLKASGTGLVDPLELEAARRVMSPGEYAQEFECAFDSTPGGTYYATQIDAAREEGRLCRVPWEPRLPVHTAWDLGIGDSTAIWFCQRQGHEWRLIDYVENSGVGLSWYASLLRSRPWVYGEHLLPHDARARELGSGRSRADTLSSLGFPPRILPRARLEDGIQAVREILPACWFDAERCATGIQALRSWRRTWDPGNKVFHTTPHHDWSSHGADAFRYLVMGDPQNRREARLPDPDSRWIV